MVATKTMFRHTVSFVVGFLTRPCCSIPALLSVLGLSGVGVAASLAPYRVWFLLVAAVFFASSFYLNFVRNRNRAGMIVWVLSVLIAVAMPMNPVLHAAPMAPARAVDEHSVNTTPNITQGQIQIRGMACAACARRLARIVNDIDGVLRADVSLDAEQIHVAYDSDKVDIERIGELISDAGFEPKLEQMQAGRRQGP